MEAVRSIRRVANEREREVSVEILVVDDGSVDGTRQTMTGLGVTVVSNEGRGVSAARNTGIRLAQSEYVGFLDDDDVWTPLHVGQHVSLLEHDPALAFVYAQGTLCDERLNRVYDPTPREPMPSGEIFDFVLHHCLAVNTIIARRRALLDVGLFDETLTASEDWDLELRLAARYPAAGVPAEVSLYRQPSSDFVTSRRWLARWRDNRRVLHTCRRLRPSGRGPWHERFTLTFATRGWYAARLLISAEAALCKHERSEALRCLRGCFQVSPLHALFRLPRYWAVLGKVGWSCLPSRRQSRAQA